MPITQLNVNGVARPLGWDPGPLLLSWQVEGAAGRHQAHARIRVWARTRSGQPLWETAGDLDWTGTPLAITPTPRTRYEVEVVVTDDLGQTHTGLTWFETGKLDEPWQGRWIGPGCQPPFAPVLTGQFRPEGPVASARLYLTGLGVYTAQLNGQPVGPEALAPGLWDYEEEVPCQSWDVTDLLAPGENTLAIALGKGWYLGRFGLERPQPMGARYAALAELRLTLQDGGEQLFCTDEGWRWRESDISGDNGIYDGEQLDRLAHQGAENPLRPVVLEDIPLRVVDRLTPPVTAEEALPVAQVLHTPAGETVLDFGQNHSGWLRFRARLPRGAEVRFDFGEVLQNGSFYNDNYRTATGGFRYRSDGREETVCQRFTYYGFRYVRVTGWPGELDAGDFDSPVLSSRLERTGWLSTGHRGLNQLYQNTLWGQKSNFLSIPTDCPQRDERLGWTGDAQVFAPTACYNMDCRAFYRGFLRFLRLEQRRQGGAVPTYVPSMGDFQACAIWSDAAALIPAALGEFSAGVMEEHYPLLRDWVDYVAVHNPGGLYAEGFQLGDWLAQDGITPQSFKGGTDDVFLASAYWLNSTRIAAGLARQLGEGEDATRFEALSEYIEGTVLDTYFTPAGRLSVDTQAAYVTALRFGLWRDKDVLLEQFRRRLRFDGYQIRCGFAAAPVLCQVLAEHGMGQLALDMLLHRGFPGWMYAVELGATTLWERWNSLLADGTISGTGMNSLNHYAYGSVIAYVYRHLAGLRPGGAGFRQAVLAPEPDVRLGHLECTCRTPAGQYISNWRIEGDGHLSLHFEIPFGCTAAVTLPRSGEEPLLLEAGSYDYRYPPAQDFRAVYHLDSRLADLAEDEAAQAILGQELPQLLGILKADDREFTTQTFRQLGHAFFLGLTPEKTARAAERLSQLLAVPAE